MNLFKISSTMQNFHREWLSGQNNNGRMIISEKNIKNSPHVGLFAKMALFDKSKFISSNFTLAFFDALEAIECIFEKCSFDFTTLSYSRLTDCSFIECHGVGIKFNNAVIKGGAFTGSTLARTVWKDGTFESIDFKGVYFGRANMSDGHFTNCDFSNAIFKNAVFKNTVFETCVFNGSVFTECELSEAKISNCAGL